MANTIIQLKHSTVTGNVPVSLANGEISINNRDGKLFYSTPLGVVTAFNPYPGPAGLDTELQFNDSGSLGGSEKLTFNKTTGLLTVSGTVRANIFSDDGVDLYDFSNNAFNTANASITVNVTQNNSIAAVFAQANSNYTSAVTKINVTHSGSSAYLLDQYSGNNPTIYVRAGETIAFSLNVSGHPFMVRVSPGGANYDTGLTHVATDGTITTGASAQGKITGTLYWKVPYDIVGSTYVYQCSIHSGMVGNVVIDQPTAIAFNQANTAINNALSASNYANGAFVTANVIQTYVTSANANISLLQTYVTSANANISLLQSYVTTANANIATILDTNTTQNNSITAAFNQANAAFTRANNSLNANTGGIVSGSITATSFITTGGNITGANTVYANNFVANTGFIQFSDGSKQYTANAGSGGGGTTDQVARDTANAAFIKANTGTSGANSFGVIYTANNNTYANAATANAQLNFVGESGVFVFANSITKTITVAGTPGAQGMVVDYGFVYDALNYAVDYGTL